MTDSTSSWDDPFDITNIYCNPNGFTIINEIFKSVDAKNNNRGFVGVVPTALQFCPLLIFSTKDPKSYLRNNRLDTSTAIYKECFNYKSVRTEVFKRITKDHGFVRYTLANNRYSGNLVFQTMAPYQLYQIGHIIETTIQDMNCQV